MPITNYTLSGDFGGLIGEVKSLRATLHLNTADGSYVNDADNIVILGGAVLVDTTHGVNPTGAFSVVLPSSTVTSLQYEVRADFVDDATGQRKRDGWRSGWFDLTADADLADKALDSSLNISPSLASLLDARLDALEAGSGGGGSSALIVVNGGTVDLDNTKPNGYLVGYKVTATTTIEGASFGAGSYIFERDSSSSSGWTYRAIAASTPVGGVTDTTGPTAGTLAGSAITSSGFTLTVSGASDAGSGLHATPYSFSTDNGSTWSAYQASNVLAVTGKSASTGYQCQHRVRDAAGNVSTGSAITVTTSAPSVDWSAYDSAIAAAAPLHYLKLTSDTVDSGSAAGTFTPTAFTVSNKALASNVATLTTSAAHGLAVGTSITVAGVDATFNGTYTVASVPTTTTLTYAKTAADVASASATGTVTGISYAALGSTTGADFNGASSVVTRSSSGTINTGGSAFTFEAIMQPDVVSGTRNIVGVAQNPQLLTIALSKAYGYALTTAVAGATTLVAGSRYHVAMVYNGTDVRVYVNGVLDGTQAVTGSIGNVGSSFRVGYAGTGYFDGRIGRVAAYTTALSAATILDHAQKAGLA